MPRAPKVIDTPADAAPPQTRRSRVESKEAAIIKAAEEIILERGFAKSTIAAIAKHAGVAEGTVYLYFTNKEDLARGVLAAFYERLTRTAARGVRKEQSTHGRLAFLARHHLKTIIKERRLLELLAVVDRDGDFGEGDVYQFNRNYVAVFDQVVRDGAWRGDLKDEIKLPVARDIFFGGLEYVMRTMLIKKRARDVDGSVEAFIDILVGGLAPRRREAPLSAKQARDLADQLSLAATDFRAGADEKSAQKS